MYRGRERETYKNSVRRGLAAVYWAGKERLSKRVPNRAKGDPRRRPRCRRRWKQPHAPRRLLRALPPVPAALRWSWRTWPP